MIEIYTFLYTVVAGAGYGLSWWLLNNYDPTKPTTQFDFYKILPVMVIAAGYGAIMTVSGVAVTESDVTGYLLKSAGIIAIAERIIMTIARVIFTKFPGLLEITGE